MTHANIIVDRDFTLGPVPRRLFGSFVEHMGRAVYTGVFEPGHPTADTDGYRHDVLDLVRELGVTVVRYPGGNFVSGYTWEDGVGPVASRPRRLDAAWHSTETNAFGLHEFVGWARAVGTEVMQAVNLGTRGVDAARELVEYANHPGGTRLSDLRRLNGAEEPFGIKLWCLGNEMDGPWQIGQKTAHDYGLLAKETAKAMRAVDPSIELVVAGSSGADIATFGAWEQTVLGHAYEEVDYVSLHAYYQEVDGDAADFLACAVDMDRYIESVIATVDSVRARGKHTKHVDLSFDEWNVWYVVGRDADDQPAAIAASGRWPQHPRIIEDTYNVTDAVVVGTMLNSLLRHGDRVRIANQAQLVNVIAPIRTEPNGPAWRQSTFWPFARMAQYARGEVLRTSVRSDRYESQKYGDVDVVDASATWDARTGEAAFFLVNRSLEEAASVSITLRGFPELVHCSAELLRVPDGGNRFTTNDPSAGERVRLRALNVAAPLDGQVQMTLPPLSWAVVRFGPADTL